MWGHTGTIGSVDDAVDIVTVECVVFWACDSDDDWGLVLVGGFHFCE